MSDEKVVIKLTNVSKKYPSPVIKGKYFYALKNVNLEVFSGAKIGITGDNGAGKSTLLKIISGITKPTSGKLFTKGKVVSLINLEAGFDEELTGRENIVFNCMLYGMTRDEAFSAQKEIIKFADIGKFIDAPFYTYSSGMRFRLAFSIAVSSNSDIFLIDEIFMSGDINFQIKTLQKIEILSKKKDVTFIMCSHYPLILKKYCDKFIFVKKGVIREPLIEDIENLSKKWNQFFSDVNLIKGEKKLLSDPYYIR
ncbi:MAG: ABC transporter ATP-binding protein [Patescibacteria group bacterium]